MDSWEKFDEAALPPKKDLYSNLNLEDISNEDYAHAQKLWDVFKIKNLGEYHNLYVQSDTLLLADVYENFRNMCLERSLKRVVEFKGALKEALNNGLRLKKVHRIIQFKQKAWLKVYIDMNTELRKKWED